MRAIREVATLTATGQVTPPKPFRQALDVRGRREEKLICIRTSRYQ
jgi:hypothetical protein